MSAEPVVREADLHFSIYDYHAAKTYELKEIINSSGIYLEFEPSLSVCNLCHTQEDYIEEWYLTENHALEIPVLDEIFLLSCLELNDTTENSKACLAKEEQHVFLSPYDCNDGLDDSAYYINISGEKYAFSDFSRSGEIIMCEINSGGVYENLTPISLGGNLILSDGGILHIWLAASGYSQCARWVEVSSFGYVVELEDGIGGIELTWTNKTLGQEKEITEIVNGTAIHRIGREELDIPGLKSIYIPSTSSAYQKLIN